MTMYVWMDMGGMDMGGMDMDGRIWMNSSDGRTQLSGGWMDR